jgi:hypothetical protein
MVKSKGEEMTVWKDLIYDSYEDIKSIWKQLKTIMLSLKTICYCFIVILKTIIFNVIKYPGVLLFKLWTFIVTISFLPIIFICWLFHSKEYTLKELVKNFYNEFDIFNDNCIL